MLFNQSDRLACWEQVCEMLEAEFGTSVATDNAVARGEYSHIKFTLLGQLQLSDSGCFPATTPPHRNHLGSKLS